MCKQLSRGGRAHVAAVLVSCSCRHNAKHRYYRLCEFPDLNLDKGQTFVIRESRPPPQPSYRGKWIKPLEHCSDAVSMSPLPIFVAADTIRRFSHAFRQGWLQPSFDASEGAVGDPLMPIPVLLLQSCHRSL